MKVIVIYDFKKVAISVLLLSFNMANKNNNSQPFLETPYTFIVIFFSQNTNELI